MSLLLLLACSMLACSTGMFVSTLVYVQLTVIANSQKILLSYTFFSHVKHRSREMFLFSSSERCIVHTVYPEC